MSTVCEVWLSWRHCLKHWSSSSEFQTAHHPQSALCWHAERRIQFFCQTEGSSFCTYVLQGNTINLHMYKSSWAPYGQKHKDITPPAWNLQPQWPNLKDVESWSWKDIVEKQKQAFCINCCHGARRLLSLLPVMMYLQSWMIKKLGELLLLAYQGAIMWHNHHLLEQILMSTGESQFLV